MTRTRRNIVFSIGLLLCAVAGVWVYVFGGHDNQLFAYEAEWGTPFVEQTTMQTGCPRFVARNRAETGTQQCKTLPVFAEPKSAVGFSAPIRRQSSARVASSCVAASSSQAWDNANIIAPSLPSPSEQTYSNVLPLLLRSRIVAGGASGLSASMYSGVSPQIMASPSSAVLRAPVLGGNDVGSVWQQWLDEYYATGATDLSGLEAWWQSNYGSGYTPDIYTEFAKWAMPVGDSVGFCLLLAVVYILWKQIKRCVR